MLARTAEDSKESGTIIGVNVKLVGSLKDPHDITIHGLVEGDVNSEQNIMIGEQAKITGPITGQTISVGGTVNGPVTALTRLEILPTGKIDGDITVADLIIRSGAVFTGQCKMTDRQTDQNEESISRSDPVNEENPEYEVE